MCHQEKQRNPWLSPLTQFSSSFQQNDHTVTLILVTDNIENVGQDLQNFSFLKQEYF